MKVGIIGGGLAGLTAACSLVSQGTQVELFESRPFLGGRIYSFTDPATSDEVDNGQHILAGFYYETFKFLSLIGSSEHIAHQKRLSIDFLDKNGRFSSFRSPNLPSPFHLIWGLLKYSRFPNSDLWNLIKKGKILKKNCGANESASDILDALGQSEEARHAFFRPLVLATLDAELDEVSGELFKNMLETFFSVPAAHSVLAYSTVGFSELFSEPAAKMIEKSGSKIFTSTHIEKVEIIDNKIISVKDSLGEKHFADAFILAVTPDALEKILPIDSVQNIDKWKFSPIVSVNIWYDKPVVDKLAVGLLDGNFHWVFDKNSIVTDKSKHRYVTLLASAAYDKIGLDKEIIIEQAKKDMEKYFPKSKTASIVATQVIKERRATALISPQMAGRRAHSTTEWNNVFLAGDWTATGLPATVESAVQSGFIAAEQAVARSEI